jgi:hypothetical protein
MVLHTSKQIFDTRDANVRAASRGRNATSVEEVQEPMTRDIRYLDKLIDELAKGKPMEKILRK